jgi:hypothetical protein
MAVMPPAPKHTRRRFQYTLGMLFFVMTACAGLVGLFAWRHRWHYKRVRLLSKPGVSYASESWNDNLMLDKVREIDVGPTVPDDVFKEIEQAFPEADVRRGSGDRLPYHLGTLTYRRPLFGPANATKPEAK